MILTIGAVGRVKCRCGASVALSDRTDHSKAHGLKGQTTKGFMAAVYVIGFEVPAADPVVEFCQHEVYEQIDGPKRFLFCRKCPANVCAFPAEADIPLVLPHHVVVRERPAWTSVLWEDNEVFDEPKFWLLR